MRMRKPVMTILVAAGLLLAATFVFFGSAEASYVNIDENGAFDVDPGAVYVPYPENYTTLGTAWDPGADTARTGGDPAPGGATWSIMGTGLYSAYPSQLDTDHLAGPTSTWVTSDFDSLLATPGLEATMVGDALDAWAGVSGFTNLGDVADGGAQAGDRDDNGGNVGDIRLARWEIEPSNVIAHTFAPATDGDMGLGGNIGGDLHLDHFRTWADDPTDTNDDPDFDLYTVLLHELGHSLGVGHSDLSGSVMYGFYTGGKQTLTADDISGIQAIYGVPEPMSMVMLGALGAGMFGARRLKKRKK